MLTTTTPAAPPAMTAPIGGARTSHRYYDPQGRQRSAATPVPVDQFGQLAGAQFRCGRCRITEWFPLGLKGAPVCGVCERRMVPLAVRDAPMLPWRAMWDAVERPLRPVWALPALGALGAGVAQADVPAAVFPAAGVAVGVLASWRARAWLTARCAGLDADDPEGQKSLRGAIARAARCVGYTAASATAWLSLPAAVGLPAGSAAGQVVLWGSLVGGWSVPAAAWWKRLRDARERVVPVLPDFDMDEPAVPDVDPGEAEVLRVWSTVVAAKQGQVIGTDADGRPMTAPRSGKLIGSWLEEWRRVTGGWSAVAVGEPGALTAEAFLNARSGIASAFRMKASMVTIIPDPDDENRALILAQRSSPIKESPRWSGPDSINVEKGTAPLAVYADGDEVMYELYRPGWGCPHVGVFGTTGSAKSELLNAIFTIDRWAHYRDEQGRAHGIIADFLIDPQQGQSFAPFLDDLAAPVACSLEEAMLLVRCLTAEALRRNRYLAREAKTWDAKRNKWRTGRKWWNPLVDGPILALTIDEAHDYLSNREFSALVTKAGRMWRKCGLQVRIATHTPLLTDLGGSMALRDMLTGGFVWVGRTANALTSQTAFNGRLPVDPRTIPALPGLAYILTGAQPKPMLARTMWEPDYYDWVRDDNDEPIGYPAVLPQVTLDTFGKEYAAWVHAARAGEVWSPASGGSTAPTAAVEVELPRSVDAVLSVLTAARSPLDMDELDAALKHADTPYSTRTVRDALRKLRDSGQVFSAKGRHELTPQARAELSESAAAAAAEEQLVFDEGGSW